MRKKALHQSWHTSTLSLFNCRGLQVQVRNLYVSLLIIRKTGVKIIPSVTARSGTIIGSNYKRILKKRPPKHGKTQQLQWWWMDIAILGIWKAFQPLALSRKSQHKGLKWEPLVISLHCSFWGKMAKIFAKYPKIWDIITKPNKCAPSSQIPDTFEVPECWISRCKVLRLTAVHIFWSIFL